MKRRAKERRSEKRKSEKKEDAGARKGRNMVFFQWFVAPDGRQVGLLKQRIRTHVVIWEMKNCAPLWRKANFQVKIYKAHGHRITFGTWDVEKVHAVVARSTFPSQHVNRTTCSDHFEGSDVGLRGRLHLAEREQTWGFCGISKNDGRRGAFEEDLQRCMSRGRLSTKHMCIRDVRRSGRWFPEKGCILEHQIFRFAKMILLDRRSTSYDLASLFPGRRNTLDKWNGKIAKRSGTRPSAVGKMRKSRRIASFLMLPTSKTEEVLQNRLLFDITKFKSWGCLAE